VRHLGRHPVRHLDVVLRNLGVRRILRHLGEVRRHRLDADRLGDLRLLGHLDVVRQPDVVRLVDPCPVKVRMDYCQGAKLDEECPCPALKRMGCCPDVGCPEPKELALLVRLVRPLLPVPQRQALQEPEKLEPEPLELPPLVRLVLLVFRLA
jgi:hypothetical protein